MVIFNDLRLSDDKKTLVIDCSIEGITVYSDMYIKSVYLDYYKNRGALSPSVPSEKAILVYENTDDDTTVKNLRKCVPDSSLVPAFGTTTFEGGMFYVIVTCDGTLPPEILGFACGSENNTDVGLVLDWKMVHETGMQFVAAMNTGCVSMCEDNGDFMSFVMLWYALRLALASCDYTQLAILWDKFKRVYSATSVGSIPGCGCTN